MYAPAELAYTMPINASEDLLEWSASRDLAAYLQEVLSKSIPVKQVLNPDRKIRITDDHLQRIFSPAQLGIILTSPP